jgi:hypothetical protein
MRMMRSLARSPDTIPGRVLRLSSDRRLGSIFANAGAAWQNCAPVKNL